VSTSSRFVGAVLLEAAWEILENSPIIIDRGGDHIPRLVRQVSTGERPADCRPGSAATHFVKKSIALHEIGTALWVHDNLTLNINMLTWPIDAIRAWQSAASLSRLASHGPHPKRPACRDCLPH
jgi:hypothetical protein